MEPKVTADWCPRAPRKTCKSRKGDGEMYRWLKSDATKNWQQAEKESQRHTPEAPITENRYWIDDLFDWVGGFFK